MTAGAAGSSSLGWSRPASLTAQMFSEQTDTSGSVFPLIPAPCPWSVVGSLLVCLQVRAGSCSPLSDPAEGCGNIHQGSHTGNGRPPLGHLPGALGGPRGAVTAQTPTSPRCPAGRVPPAATPAGYPCGLHRDPRHGRDPNVRQRFRQAGDGDLPPEPSASAQHEPEARDAGTEAGLRAGSLVACTRGRCSLWRQEAGRSCGDGDATVPVSRVCSLFCHTDPEPQLFVRKVEPHLGRRDEPGSPSLGWSPDP